MLNAVVPRKIFIGSDTRGPFSLVTGGTPIRCDTASDLIVTRFASTTAASGTVLVLNTDYTVDVTNPLAASVTLAAGQAVLAATERLVVERRQPRDQELSLSSGGDFSGPALAAALDKLSEQLQEVQASADRAVKAAWPEEQGFELQPVPTRAGRSAIFDANGKLVAGTIADDAVIGANLSAWAALNPADALDNINGVRFVANNAALTALTTATGLADNAEYQTGGRASERDGGEGTWIFDALSTATANTGTVLAINGGGPGRFFRKGVAGSASILWFGTDSAAFIAAEALGRVVQVPAGAYTVASSVSVTNANTVFLIHPGATFSGAQQASLLESTHRIIWIGRSLDAYPPPSGEGPDRSIHIRMPTWSNIYALKSVSGATASTSSDSRFSTFYSEHLNDMRRPDPINFYYTNGAAYQAQVLMGYNQPARGASLAFYGEVAVKHLQDYNNVGNSAEPCMLHGTLRALLDGNNALGNYWGQDLNVWLPDYGSTTASREGLGVGISLLMQKLTDGNAIDLTTNPYLTYRGSYGQTIQTGPGLGLAEASLSGKIFYPLRAGIHLNGYTGAHNTVLNGTDAGATPAFDVAFWSGGWGGAWFDWRSGATVPHTSRMGTGFRSEHYETYGVHIRTRHGSGVALRIDADAGPSDIYTNINNHGALKTSIPASSVSNWVFIGAATGGYLRCLPDTTDANIGLTIETKGNGWGQLLGGLGGTARFAWSDTGIAFYGGTPAAKPDITGVLSAVTDANAKAVLTSIINAFTSITLASNGTT